MLLFVSFFRKIALFLEIGNDSLFYFPKIVERSRFCYNTNVRFDSIDCDSLFHSVLAPPRLDRIKRPPIPRAVFLYAQGVGAINDRPYEYFLAV